MGIVKAVLPVAVKKEPVVRDSRGLRDALFDELDAFRRGQGDPSRSNAIAKLATTILTAAKLEFDISRARKADEPASQPVPLGTIVDGTAK